MEVGFLKLGPICTYAVLEIPGGNFKVHSNNVRVHCNIEIFDKEDVKQLKHILESLTCPEKCIPLLLVSKHWLPQQCIS